MILWMLFHYDNSCFGWESLKGLTERQKKPTLEKSPMTGEKEFVGKPHLACQKAIDGKLIARAGKISWRKNTF